MNDHQKGVVTVRDGHGTFECAITSSAQVSRKKQFPRRTRSEGWVGHVKSL
jgi:hypothetical protein